MMKKDCFFDLSQSSQLKSFFDENGFVGLNSFLSHETRSSLEQAISKCLAKKKLIIGDDTMAPNQDVIYLDEVFQELFTDDRIVNVVECLMGYEIELQHSKFNAKPRNACDNAEVAWHQDYPFFPHTNFSLLACVVHLDDETVDSGPLEFVPGSHTWGPLNHNDDNGNFAYRCTDPIINEINEPVVLNASKFDITLHHSCTLHRSKPKIDTSRERRLLIYQYRAIDAIQLAGVIWKCNGAPVSNYNKSHQEREKNARFPDGTTVSLRGNSGQLFDIHSKLSK